MAFVTLCGRSSVYCIYTQTFHKVFSISRGYWTNYWLTTIYLQPYFDIILVVYVVYVKYRFSYVSFLYQLFIYMTRRIQNNKLLFLII